ncbi:hypothetical protein SLEP1_g56378 [Rubroshorea leprosula]|uniref:Uncharacterized protein n=1 Tax=Rubroshorea leprosula TaxID=152421 RepID=A0AAV5MIA7_9ROSI|nr:hypothetical protein SLEP1_g56378 [Rubroshorea leprosula]
MQWVSFQTQQLLGRWNPAVARFEQPLGSCDTADRDSQVKPDNKHQRIGTTGRNPNSIKSSRERSSPTAALPDRLDSLGIKRGKPLSKPKRGDKTLTH